MSNLVKLDDSLEEKLKLIRTERYACQSVARKALPSERVSMCLRRINGDHVAVRKHRKTGKGFYSGLLVCGSVWHCPVCAAKISERRRKELEIAFSEFQKEGGFISMLTLTFSHERTDRLKDILYSFGQATQKFMSGRAFNNIRNEIGLIGRVRVLEVTHGDNGFHPHAHIALFHENEIDLDDIRFKMYDLWEKACNKVGLKTSFEYGLDLQSAEEAERYMSKHGTWSLEQELSKSHIKKGKLGSLTPFDFLRMYLKTEEEKYIHLYREYATYFKGKRQVQWSPGLKKRFVLEDKTDEELAEEKIEEADLLGLVGYDNWKLILKYELRTILLDNVEKHGFEEGLYMTLMNTKKRKKLDSPVNLN